MFQSSYLKPSADVCSLETAADVTAMQVDKERYSHGFKVPWPPRILKKGWNSQSIPPNYDLNHASVPFQKMRRPLLKRIVSIMIMKELMQYGDHM